MDKLKLVQEIGGEEICEGCGPDADCGEIPIECIRVTNAIAALDAYMQEADKIATTRERINCLHDAMPDSEIPKFFKRATGRKHTSKELCVNDIRRMLMLFWNERIAGRLEGK